MAELRRRPLHSYRDDTAVPEFPDTGPIAVMDGECVLCASGARLISRFDRAKAFRICPTQSTLGTALSRHYGLEPDDPEAWLFLENGSAWSGMDAIIRIGAAVDGLGRLLGLMRVIPGRAVSGSIAGSRATATSSARPTSARCPIRGCVRGCCNDLVRPGIASA